MQFLVRRVMTGIPQSFDISAHLASLIFGFIEPYQRVGPGAKAGGVLIRSAYPTASKLGR